MALNSSVVMCGDSMVTSSLISKNMNMLCEMVVGGGEGDKKGSSASCSYRMYTYPIAVKFPK